MSIETKGELNGVCNLTACRSDNLLTATWLNHGNGKYYCKVCAKWLNSDHYNKDYSMKKWNHDLCTEEK